MTPKASNGDRERALDELYAAPPDQFVETRKRLAKELRDAGHADAAAELRAARKPTVAASAINRAVRADSRKASDLIASARELRRAHAQALRGPGDRNFLRDAARQERAAATAMADAAAGILEREHGAPSAEVVRRIGETLDAVALDDEVMARFASGRLEREAQAAGLSLPVEADAEAAAPAPKRPKRPARDTERRREAERRSRAAERELSRARRAVEAKERALERTRGQLKRAQSGFEDAERDLRAAQAEFEEAKRKAAAARR